MYLPFPMLLNTYVPLSLVVAESIFPDLFLTNWLVSAFNKLTVIPLKVFSFSSFLPSAFASYQAIPLIILFPFAILLLSILLFLLSSLLLFVFFSASIIWVTSSVFAISIPSTLATAWLVITLDSYLSL